MTKQRYAVRFYLSRKGKGFLIGSLFNPRTGKRTPVFSHPTQFHYTGNTVAEALAKGLRYFNPRTNFLTSYTVTDRLEGTKTNIKTV